MEGAFNHFVLFLSRDAKAQDVIDRIDDVLRVYGGSGAYIRDDQLSIVFFPRKCDRLEGPWHFPIIFLSVAAFLLNVVVSSSRLARNATDRSVRRHFVSLIWRRGTFPEDDFADCASRGSDGSAIWSLAWGDTQ